MERTWFGGRRSVKRLRLHSILPDARASSFHHRLRIEPLEDRRMLSVGTIDNPIAAGAIEVFQTQDALFAENAGQWANDELCFGYNKGGTQIYFTDDAIEFALSRRELEKNVEVAPVVEDGSAQTGLERDSCSYASTHFSLRFDNAHATAPTGADRAETIFNYHLGEETTWVDGVATYKTVVYNGLYDGIDLHAFSQSGQMKYEFHVAPGGDWSQIALSYDGVEGLSIAADGSLHITTALGDIVDEDLYIYQTIDGQQVEVAGQFTLIDQDTYTFTVTGQYDPTQELVIDPNITWGTYLGGSGEDGGNGIALDPSGNILVTGDISSSGWASGGWDTSYNRNWDAFAAKLSSSGAHLWSTYIGGSGNDYGNDIAVDLSGNVLVTGQTSSSGWTSGGWDTSYNSSDDNTFVVKLSPSGAHLWSTYLGGRNVYDAPRMYNGIAVDASGNVLVTGTTELAGWASGGWDTSHNGDLDAFVVKLSSGGAHLWSTYLGGSGEDSGYDIAVDKSGNVLVTGGTCSVEEWVSGGWDTSVEPGDAFVVKFNSGGAHLWSTYVGGSDYEFAWGVATDPSGNVLVAGQTVSSGWTSGGADTSYNGDTDAFVVKLSPTGAHLWSTYLGGSYTDWAFDIATDTAGNVLVAGPTLSSGWTSRGPDTSRSGTSDAFAAKLRPSGELLWSTYLGGSDWEYGMGIVAEPSGNVLVTGYTDSPGWLSGGYDTSLGGARDGFVVKIETSTTSIIVADAGNPYTVNEGGSVTLSAAGSYDPTGSIISYAWDLDNDGQYDDHTGLTTSFGRTADGDYTVRVKVTAKNGDYDMDATTVNRHREKRGSSCSRRWTIYLSVRLENYLECLGVHRSGT